MQYQQFQQQQYRQQYRQHRYPDGEWPYGHDAQRAEAEEANEQYYDWHPSPSFAPADAGQFQVPFQRRRRRMDGYTDYHSPWGDERHHRQRQQYRGGKGDWGDFDGDGGGAYGFERFGRGAMPRAARVAAPAAPTPGASSSGAPTRASFLELLLALYEPVDVSEAAHEHLSRRLSALHRRFGPRNARVLTAFERLVIGTAALATQELAQRDDPRRCFDLLARCDDWTCEHSVAAAFPRRTIALRLLAVNTTASVYARAQKFDKALGSLGAASALAAAAHTSSRTAAGALARAATVSEKAAETLASAAAAHGGGHGSLNDGEEEPEAEESWVPLAIVTKLATCHLLLSASGRDQDSATDDSVLQKTLNMAETAVYDAQELIERQRSTAASGDPHVGFLCFGNTELRHGLLLALAYYQLANALKARNHEALSEDWFRKAAAQIDDLGQKATQMEEALEDEAQLAVETATDYFEHLSGHRDEDLFYGAEGAHLGGGGGNHLVAAGGLKARWEAGHPELRGARAAAQALADIKRLVQWRLQGSRPQRATSEAPPPVRAAAHGALRASHSEGILPPRRAQDGFLDPLQESQRRRLTEGQQNNSMRRPMSATALGVRPPLSHGGLAATDGDGGYVVSSTTSSGGVIFLGGPSAFEEDMAEEEERKKSHAERVRAFRQQKKRERRAKKRHEAARSEPAVVEMSSSDRGGSLPPSRAQDSIGQKPLVVPLSQRILEEKNARKDANGETPDAGSSEDADVLRSLDAAPLQLQRTAGGELWSAPIAESDGKRSGQPKEQQEQQQRQRRQLSPSRDCPPPEGQETAAFTVDVDISNRAPSPVADEAGETGESDVDDENRKQDEAAVVTIQRLNRGVAERRRIAVIRARERHSSAVDRIRRRRQEELRAATALQRWAREIANQWQVRRETQSKVLAASAASQRMKRNAAALVLQRFYFQWGAQERREIESGTESGDAKRYALGAIELPDVPPKKADDDADEPQQNANGSEGEINEEDSFEDDDGPSELPGSNSRGFTRKDTSATGALATALTETSTSTSVPGPSTPFRPGPAGSTRGEAAETREVLDTLVEVEDEDDDVYGLRRTMSEQFSFTGGVYMFSPDGAGAAPTPSLLDLVADSDSDESAVAVNVFDGMEDTSSSSSSSSEPAIAMAAAWENEEHQAEDSEAAVASLVNENEDAFVLHRNDESLDDENREDSFEIHSPDAEVHTNSPIKSRRLTELSPSSTSAEPFTPSNLSSTRYHSTGAMEEFSDRDNMLKRDANDSVLNQARPPAEPITPGALSSSRYPVAESGHSWDAETKEKVVYHYAQLEGFASGDHQRTEVSSTTNGEEERRNEGVNKGDRGQKIEVIAEERKEEGDEEQGRVATGPRRPRPPKLETANRRTQDGGQQEPLVSQQTEAMTPSQPPTGASPSKVRYSSPSPRKSSRSDFSPSQLSSTRYNHEDKGGTPPSLGAPPTPKSAFSPSSMSSSRYRKTPASGPLQQHEISPIKKSKYILSPSEDLSIANAIMEEDHQVLNETTGTDQKPNDANANDAPVSSLGADAAPSDDTDSLSRPSFVSESGGTERDEHGDDDCNDGMSEPSFISQASAEMGGEEASEFQLARASDDDGNADSLSKPSFVSEPGGYNQDGQNDGDVNEELSEPSILGGCGEGDVIIDRSPAKDNSGGEVRSESGPPRHEGNNSQARGAEEEQEGVAAPLPAVEQPAGKPAGQPAASGASPDEVKTKEAGDDEEDGDNDDETDGSLSKPSFISESGGTEGEHPLEDDEKMSEPSFIAEAVDDEPSAPTEKATSERSDEPQPPEQMQSGAEVAGEKQVSGEVEPYAGNGDNEMDTDQDADSNGELSRPSYLESSEGEATAMHEEVEDNDVALSEALEVHARSLGVPSPVASAPEAVQALVKESLLAPLPMGWTAKCQRQQRETSTAAEADKPFFVNEYTGEESPEHPLDDFFRAKIQKVLAASDQHNGSVSPSKQMTGPSK